MSQKTLPRESKNRKSKRTSTSTIPHGGVMSIKDPKIFQKLIKNNGRHEIPRLIDDLKEDKKNGIGLSSATRRPAHRCGSFKERIEVPRKEVNQAIEVPKDFEERFVSEYQQFLNLYTGMINDPEVIAEPLDREFYRTEENMKLLCRLYYLCDSNYYEANALQLWRDLPKFFSTGQLETMDNGQIKDFYQIHLFFFDRFSKTKMTVQDLKEILRLDAHLLADPFVKYAFEMRKSNMIEQFFDKIAQPQCVLLKNFVNFLGIDQELFSVKYLKEHLSDQMVDIHCQNPENPFNGFSQRIPEQGKRKVPLSEYIQYMKDSLFELPQNRRDDNGLIQVASNINIRDWKSHMDHLSAKVPSYLLCNSNKDAMKYLGATSKGINFPHISLEVEDSWIGGHESSLRQRIVNLNHGPNSHVWYVIGADQVLEFKKGVKQFYGVDIYNTEGKWFCDVDFCLRTRIKIYYFTQEPGDIVILGPGSLFWKKCLGISMTTQWNICGKEKLQFEKAFERIEINRQIGFKNIVPIRHVALEILLNDTYSIKEECRGYLAVQLHRFFQEEIQKYARFKEKNEDFIFMYERKGTSVYFCTMCNSETLNFYAYCDACSKAKKGDGVTVLICLACFENHIQNCKNETKKLLTYCKRSEKVLVEFQKILKNIEPEILKMKGRYKNLDHRIKEMIEEDQKLQEASMFDYKKKVSANKNSVKKLSNFELELSTLLKINAEEIKRQELNPRSSIEPQQPKQKMLIEQQSLSARIPASQVIAPFSQTKGSNIKGQMEIEPFSLQPIQPKILPKPPGYNPTINKGPFTATPTQEIVPSEKNSEAFRPKIEFQIKGKSDKKPVVPHRHIFETTEIERTRTESPPKLQLKESFLTPLGKVQDPFADFNPDDFLSSLELNGKRPMAFFDEETNLVNNYTVQKKFKANPLIPENKPSLTTPLKGQEHNNKLDFMSTTPSFLEPNSGAKSEQETSMFGLNFNLPSFTKTNYFLDRLNNM